MFTRKMEYTILTFLIFWRVISVLIIQTYHVPDEYWQSLEVAHNLAFGYGYLTWEWKSKIRSYVYPFLIAIIYKLLSIMRLDYAGVIIYLPRILQGFVSGFADYRFYIWTRNDWSLLFQLINWYWYYCASRTLTNTLETALTMIALSVFPWKEKPFHGSKFLWIVGFMCVTRPTAAIIWTPLCIYHITTSRQSVFQLIQDYIFIGSSTFCYSVLIDSFCYGKFIITPWEFFKVNILNNIAGHYGIEEYHWYLTAALPTVLGFQVFILPVVIYQIIKNRKTMPRQWICLITIIWTIGIYSLLQHKEFRFILPLIPLFIYICTSTNYPGCLKLPESVKKAIVIFIITFNLILGLYCGLTHQNAPLEAMKFIRKQLITDDNSNLDIMFLMPCHSTPFYSHLHINVPMRFLTCEPNLKNLQNYEDETDIFFKNPMKWLNDNYNYKDDNSTFLPRVLVMYDNLVPQIKSFLDSYYFFVVRFFDTHYPLPKRSEYIVLYKLRTIVK